MSSVEDYELLDSGEFQKLERFGPIVLRRPCAQALWPPQLQPRQWQGATASFQRRQQQQQWQDRHQLPESWIVQVAGIRFELRSTDFGHLGIFPEQRSSWLQIRELCRQFAHRHGRPARTLNLFAYSGGSSLAAAQGGSEVCHVDASKGMVQWARENAAHNELQNAPIRWIVDDVMRFLKREERRERLYDLIILDPPSYGRGAQGEIFKIEEHLGPLLAQLANLISAEPIGVLLSCHTPEFTGLSLNHLLAHHFGPEGQRSHGELLLEGAPKVRPVPSGHFCWWLGKGNSLP
jgi:23S rRNA (cytosine1962-C5)-methyltransferase